MDITPFDLAGSLQAHNVLVQQQRANDTQNAFAQALPMLQSDPQNALATIGKTGNLDAYARMSTVINQMDEHKKAALATKTEALGKVGMEVEQYKDPVVRKAVAMSKLPLLAQYGVTADDIQRGDWSDNGVQTLKNLPRTTAEMIAQSNTDRTAQLAADKFGYEKTNDAREFKLKQGTAAETRRHNQAVEGAMTGPVDVEALAADPVIGSHVKNILSGNETMAQVPAALRNKVSIALQGAGSGSFSPLAGSRLTLASSRITAPFTNMAAYKLTADGLPYLQRIDAAFKHKGSVSDQDLLDSLTKLNTGGNAVTDAQVKLITDGKSFSDTIGTWSNKVQNGGVLSENQRKQIKEIANDIFKNYRKGYQPVYEQASKQLKAAGIPEQFWTIPDLNKLNAGQADILADKPAGGGGNGKPPTVSNW